MTEKHFWAFFVLVFGSACFGTLLAIGFAGSGVNFLMVAVGAGQGAALGYTVARFLQATEDDNRRG